MAKIYHPEAFQGTGHLKRQKAKKSYFEGWYVKCVSEDRKTKFAFIPGVFIGRNEEESHAFLQILNGTDATYEYVRFSLKEFEILNPDHFAVRVGNNRLSIDGIELSVSQGQFTIEGNLTFTSPSAFPVTMFSPGIMGPFAFTPFMECYHGLVSLDHEIEGKLNINGKDHPFGKGRGYIEKDWGKSFPSAYVWMQSNHFEKPGSLFASAARIPWLTGSFRGFIIAILYNGELKRFATYTGARLESLKISKTDVDLIVADKTHRLKVHARRSHGAVLMAPYEHSMIERVSETMTSEIQFELTELKTGNVLADHSEDAALEVQGKLEQIADQLDI